jgi:hypothetical protein
MGRGALSELVRLYEQSRPQERATIGQVLYNLGWKSEEAKHALMADARTDDRALRLQVQWALGRVSDDPAMALQALSILTGQTKGFQPDASPQARRSAVEAWRRWLAEYRENL